MARSIHCFACATRMHFPRVTSTRTTHYEDTGNETERFVWGNLRVNCVCDTCAAPLQPGFDRAVALTVETNGMGIVPWEHEYLEISPPPATTDAP